MNSNFPISDKPFAYSYIRMSTTIQLKGDSLRRQKDLSKSYAEENNLHLVEDFKLEDIGVSAFNGDNSRKGALKEFLDAVERSLVPKGSYLLVESLDRLSREKIVSALSIFLSIQQAGINIVTLSDNQVYLAKEQNMQALIYSISIMSRAYEESETKSRRLNAAWNNKRNKANEIKMTKLAPAWLTLSKDRKYFTVIEGKAAIVRKIFELSKSGMGAYSITRLLNNEGTPTFGKSKLWAISSVSKILKNRAVLGEFQPHAIENGSRVPVGIPIQDYFPSIIDSELFLFVQLNRSRLGQKGKGRKGDNLPNLFTNLAVCMHCKSSMHFINKGKGNKGGTYLRCSKSLKSNGCSPAMWKYKDFESSFLYFVNEINWVDVISADSTEKEYLKLMEDKDVANQKLAAQGLERDRIFSLFKDPRFDAEYYTNQLFEIQEQIIKTEELIAKAEEEISNLELNIHEQDFMYEDVIKTFQEGGVTTYEQRLKLKELFGRVIKSLELCPATPEEKEKLLYKKILDGAVTSDEARSLEKQISSWEENEKDIIKDKGRSFKVLYSYA
jgi:DNA invertase Pin-like site-specific DNA recombinase